MKKLSFIALFLAIVMLACCCTACDSLWPNHEKTDVTTDQQETEPSKTENESANQQESEKAEAPIVPPTLDTDDERVDFVREEIAVTYHDPTQFYIAHQVNNVECIDEFTDGVCNYYYYYLGYLENFPLVFSSIAHHTGQPGTTPNYSMTVSSESQESIEDSISKSVTVTNSTSSANEVSIGVDIGLIPDEFTISPSFSTSWGEEHSQSSTTENTHSVAKSWGNSTSHTFQLSLKQDDPAGYYRYVHYAKKCFVYAIVAYDLNTKQFYIDYVSFAEESVKDSIVVLEYSVDGVFSSDKSPDLIFDKSLLATIDPNKTLPSIAPEAAEPIDIPVNKHLCKKDTGFNPNTNGEDDLLERHKNFDIGHLTIYGCKQNGNYYTIIEPENFSIEYIFNENTAKLSWRNDLKVANDSETSVMNMDLKGQKVGYGAYQVKIIRKDGATDNVIVKCDFMNSRTVGSIEKLIANYPNIENISRIEITIVYELEEYSWNLFNINSYQYTNWRSDYVFYFQ